MRPLRVYNIFQYSLLSPVKCSPHHCLRKWLHNLNKSGKRFSRSSEEWNGPIPTFYALVFLTPLEGSIAVARGMCGLGILPPILENRMQKPGGNCASMPAGKEASLLSRSCKESLIQHTANQMYFIVWGC